MESRVTPVATESVLILETQVIYCFRAFPVVEDKSVQIYQLSYSFASGSID
jgi:hypothetical protein